MNGNTSVLSEANRIKLAKILGMTGGAHDGERAAAAERANAFVRGLDLTWDDVLTPPPPPQAPPPAHNPFYQARHATGEPTPWRDKATMVAASPRANAWERGFAESLLGFPYLSDKQQVCLDHAYSKVKRSWR